MSRKHMGVQLIGVAPIKDSICNTVLMGLTKQFEGQWNWTKFFGDFDGFVVLTSRSDAYVCRSQDLVIFVLITDKRLCKPETQYLQELRWWYNMLLRSHIILLKQHVPLISATYTSLREPIGSASILAYWSNYCEIMFVDHRLSNQIILSRGI